MKISCLSDFWNFQNLPALSLKNNLHRRRFRSDCCVSHFPFRLKDWKIVFSSDAEAYSKPFQTYLKHKMELFAKIAIGYFDKKLCLRCLIGDSSDSSVTSLDPGPPYCWHSVNTSWLKIIEAAVRRCSSK